MFVAQSSLKYFHVCCHHFKATKDNCGKLLSKKFSRANLFVNDIGNINLADRRRKNQAVCVKLRVRAGSEVAGDHEAVRDDTTFMDIKAETELGLSGQRRDIVTVRRCC